MRITAVLAASAKGNKLPAMLIFKGKAMAPGKAPAANSIERELNIYKDTKENAYPRGVVYAVNDKAWHTQRVFKDVWLPQVWNRRPGREGYRAGALESYRQPNSLLAWDDYTVHKTDLCRNAMEESHTTLFLIPGGLTPEVQPYDGLINQLFKSNMSKVYDDYILPTGSCATTAVTRTPH